MVNGSNLISRWQQLSLATQFAIASSMVLFLSALAIGSWVSSRIEEGVVRNSGTATALYMESFISPISQELAIDEQLSENASRALEEVFTNTPLGERIVSYKIWKEGGRIVAASDKSLIGRSFPVDEELARAWNGEVQASFDNLDSEESAGESAMDVPLLEIYAPIREVWSGKVIAVSEFYEVQNELANDLKEARRATWLTVAAIVTGLGGLLYAIVLQGSLTIERQRRDLDRQFGELHELSQRNRNLRLRVQSAARRSSEANETALRRFGADLHDGPAQYLAFAALRLDGLRDIQRDDGTRQDLESVKGALDQAMAEVRAISRGMSLPDIAEKSPEDVVAMAVQEHRGRTGSDVDLASDCECKPALAPAERICLYRFVQEGLNNAHRHAGGVGLAVALHCQPGQISVSVMDRGPGFGSNDPQQQFGLGLSGLRDRVEAIGGNFGVGNRPGGGAEVKMSLETGA